MKSTPLHIFFGGSAYNDREAVQAAAKSRETQSWSALKSVKNGDRILVYCDHPDSAIVASAEAVTDAEKADDYPFRCEIGKVRMLARPVHRTELQKHLSKWAWATATRGRTTVKPELQELVWAVVHKLADKPTQGATTTQKRSSTEEVITDPAASVEGRVRESWSTVRERSRKNRESCLRALPPHLRDAPPCAVCGMTFLGRYGEIGRRFIHVHHIRPAASLDPSGELVVPADELAPVCPNCHAMLHIGQNAGKGEVRSVQELQSIMRATGEEPKPVRASLVGTPSVDDGRR